MYCIQSGHVQTQHSQVPLLATSYTANKVGRKVRLSYAIAFQSIYSSGTPARRTTCYTTGTTDFGDDDGHDDGDDSEDDDGKPPVPVHTCKYKYPYFILHRWCDWWRGCWIFYCLLALLFLLLFDLLA